MADMKEKVDSALSKRESSAILKQQDKKRVKKEYKTQRKRIRVESSELLASGASHSTSIGNDASKAVMTTNGMSHAVMSDTGAPLSAMTSYINETSRSLILDETSSKSSTSSPVSNDSVVASPTVVAHLMSKLNELQKEIANITTQKPIVNTSTLNTISTSKAVPNDQMLSLIPPASTVTSLKSSGLQSSADDDSRSATALANPQMKVDELEKTVARSKAPQKKLAKVQPVSTEMFRKSSSSSFASCNSDSRAKTVTANPQMVDDKLDRTVPASKAVHSGKKSAKVLSASTEAPLKSSFLSAYDTDPRAQPAMAKSQKIVGTSGKAPSTAMPAGKRMPTGTSTSTETSFKSTSLASYDTDHRAQTVPAKPQTIVDNLWRTPATSKEAMPVGKRMPTVTAASKPYQTHSLFEEELTRGAAAPKPTRNPVVKKRAAAVTNRAQAGPIFPSSLQKHSSGSSASSTVSSPDLVQVLLPAAPSAASWASMPKIPKKTAASVALAPAALSAAAQLDSFNKEKASALPMTTKEMQTLSSNIQKLSGKHGMYPWYIELILLHWFAYVFDSVHRGLSNVILPSV